jgi:hypothetical protein
MRQADMTTSLNTRSEPSTATVVIRTQCRRSRIRQRFDPAELIAPATTPFSVRDWAGTDYNDDHGTAAAAAAAAIQVGI